MRRMTARTSHFRILLAFADELSKAISLVGDRQNFLQRQRRASSVRRIHRIHDRRQLWHAPARHGMDGADGGGTDARFAFLNTYSR